MAKAVAAAVKLPRIRLLTLHASSGSAVMQAAREAAGDKKNRPKLLGVTVLTSFDETTLHEIGMPGTIEARAVALAQMARKRGWMAWFVPRTRHKRFDRLAARNS